MFALDLGIDELLLPDRSGAPFTEAPGRMARNTAFTILLIGSAFATWQAEDIKRGTPPGAGLGLTISRR